MAPLAAILPLLGSPLTVVVVVVDVITMDLMADLVVVVALKQTTPIREELEIQVKAMRVAVVFLQVTSALAVGADQRLLAPMQLLLNLAMAALARRVQSMAPVRPTQAVGEGEPMVALAPSVTARVGVVMVASVLLALMAQPIVAVAVEAELLTILPEVQAAQGS
jgi:hypothetical protein